MNFCRGCRKRTCRRSRPTSQCNLHPLDHVQTVRVAHQPGPHDEGSNHEKAQDYLCFFVVKEVSLALTRRQFLRRSALAIAGVGLTQTTLARGVRAIITEGPAKKVLVLGAGMAGLVAAYELKKLGHVVTILEA